MIAIQLVNVQKGFKRRRIARHNYTTLKTSFIDLFRKDKKVKQEEYFYALKGINYAIKEGNVTGIIGLNGSGKSTLLKCIAGIYKPDQGRININGRVSALIELGAGFHPEFTGRENILINGIILGLSRREIKKRYDSIVKFAELEDFIDNPIRTYSSGMYMRLGFSVAVNVDPDVLLIDEILSVGDESFVHKCQDKIAEFKKNGRTIVIATHDLSAAERWCDEIMWLDNGAVKLIGHPRRVIDAYREYIARIEEKRFTEEHRFIEGELKSVHSKGELRPDGWEEGFSGSEEKGGYIEGKEGGEEKDKQRWGTREVELYSVRFLDKDRQERHIYNQGEPMFIEIKYKVNKKVEKPVFGIGIFSPEGVCCYGTNTFIEEIKTDLTKDEGLVIFEIEGLDFIEGTYLLDVAVHAEDGYPYDYQSRLYSFAVKSKIKDVGIFRPRHKWVIQ